MSQKNIFSKSFSWLANHTYRKIPAIIQNLQNKPIQTHYLTYQDLNSFPKNAKNIGFDVIRRAHRKKYNIQSENLQHKKKHQIVQKFIAQKSQDYDKPIQLVCPICMDFFSGPVSTTCGHTFCFQCLDQAILFNPNCPVCRNQIRGQELIICRSIQTLILSYFCKFIDQVYQQAFYKKQEQFQNWMTQRSINISSIMEEQEIDVRDTEFVWCKAKVLKVYQKDNKNNSIMVHYDGWSQNYDEIIYLNSQRLAKLGFYTDRKQIPHYNLNSQNRSHMYSYVVIQRNSQQNNLNLDPLNGFYMINNEQDNIRSNYLWGIQPFRRNQIDIINEEQSSWEFNSDIISSDRDQNTIIQSRGHINLTQINLSNSQLSIRTSNEIELTQLYHHENRRTFAQNNSPVNISVEWSQQQQNQIHFNHHRRFIDQNSWSINEEKVEESESQQQNQEINSLLYLMRRQKLQAQYGNISQHEQNQNQEEDFMTDIWRDWKKYKIMNGLLEVEVDNQKGFDQDNEDNFEKEQNKKEKNQNEYEYEYEEQEQEQEELNSRRILRKGKTNNRQQKDKFFQANKIIEDQIFFNQGQNSFKEDQNSIRMSIKKAFQKNNSQELQLSLIEKQAEMEYEQVTFNQLCKQFDQQFMKELQREKQILQHSFDPLQQKNGVKKEKQIQQLFFQKKLLEIQYQQFNPQSEQKTKVYAQKKDFSHNSKQEFDDTQCQLNKQISNFIHRLMQTAEENYNSQSLSKKQQKK